MAPLSRRARRALAVGAGATVAYAAVVAYRRARDAALEAPDARTKRLEEANALAALERELAALDEETLRGSGASARPAPRRDNAGSSGDSLASGSASDTSSLAERTRATASARAGDEATSDARRSAERASRRSFSTTSRDANDERDENDESSEPSERALPGGRGGSGSGSGSDSTPDFFASTKFFACLELEESRELFDDAAETVEVPPKAVVFRQGDDSSSGIYVVERGSLGVYLQEEQTTEADAEPGRTTRRSGPTEARDKEENTREGKPNPSESSPPDDARRSADGDVRQNLDDPDQNPDPPQTRSSKTLGPPFLTNILREGESVGDIDVLDNAPRGVSVVAGAEGARLVRIGQKELFAFIAKHPETLETYVTQAVARLWRVAHFVLVDFLGLPRSTSGDAVRLNAPSTRFDTCSPAREKGKEEKEDVRREKNLREPTRVSPAFALTNHVAALERHCEALRIDDSSDIEISPQKLYAEGEHATCMFLVLEGVARADATPWPRGDGQRGTPFLAPALLGASAFLTRSARQETVRVEALDTNVATSREASSSSFTSSSDSLDDAESSKKKIRVLVIGARELAALRVAAPEAYIAVLLASTCSLSRLLRQFISLGLNRVWLRAGESAYVAGEQATSMFVLISGRIRLLRGAREDDDDGDGGGDDGDDPNCRPSSSYAYYRARPNEERGRGETIGEAPLLANGRYPSTATCLRDSELVRMSRGSLTLVCARYPTAASRLLEAMARKLHATLKPGSFHKNRPDLVTIALVPASKNGDETVTAALAAALRLKLSRFGPTLLLDERAARAAHSDGTVTRLENAFYRSKLTGWMAQQEENYRFILLQADASGSAWSQVCVSQADRVLVVARTTHETKESLRDLPGVTPSRAERRLLWRRRRGAAVELILVHDPGCAPRSTAKWRASRPEVERHHMLRLSSEEDVERLARHVAGRAVGVILTGGGGHGLAHLGALRALEDLGVPVDVVGGTSRGALMAALYAKYASTTHMLPRVKELVGALSSPRHLLTDLTLPILSVFSGKGLDKILRQSLGEDDVEDLWLPFFCCSTNLTRGSLSTHVSGAAWKRVRASMTTLGLLPPVRDDESGELLVDGGYLNAIPADVMRETMGVDVVIAIDVEDDDYLAFRDLTPRDGGLGGWRLLWERVNPLAALSSSSKKKKNDANHVSYAGLLSALLHATSKRQFAQASREHAINLYLRPPGVSGWTAPLTPKRVDALVRRAHRHSCVAVAAWRAREEREARAAERAVAETGERGARSSSASKYSYASGAETADARGLGADGGTSATNVPRTVTSVSSGYDVSSGRSSGGSLPLFVSSAATEGSPSAPSSARRSLERITADRTGRADRDDAFVESVVRVPTPRRREPPGGAPVAKSAKSSANAKPASTRSRDDRVDRLKTRSVTLPPPAAPGADDAVTRLRVLSRGSVATGSSVSSAGSFRSALEEGGSGGGSPRDSRDGGKRLDTGASTSHDDESRSIKDVVASSLLYRGGAKDDEVRGNRNRHVRRHSAHVDAAALKRALLATRRDVAVWANSHGETPSHGAPVFGALLARRAEDEDLWRRAFEGHPPLDVRFIHESHSRGMTHRRRSLSAGDLAGALAKDQPVPFETTDRAAEVVSRGSAA